MKSNPLTILIAVLITQSAFGQWSQQTTPAGGWYEGIHFVNANIGWAVGWDGLIIKTTDGGQTWNTQTSGTPEDLMEVYFIDQNNGWVIGDWNNIGNTLLKTTNGGSTWQLTDPDLTTKRYYEDIQFVGLNNGWIVGASCKILHTSDGGANWTNQSVGTTTPTLQSVFFINTTTGWVSSSDGRIWKTTDAGTNWVLQSTPTATLADPLYDVFFIDANKGWACGDKGVVLTTSNGGTTWTQIATNVAGNNCHILSIHFTSATTGFANGCWGQVIKTTDGGFTWTQANASVGFGEKIFFTNASVGWCAGSSGIAKTTNGGNPTTGIAENESENGILIYPNPASSYITLDLPTNINNATVSIYNIHGQLQTHTTTNKPQTTIDLDGLTNGVYLVEVASDNKVRRQMFIKQL